MNFKYFLEDSMSIPFNNFSFFNFNLVMEIITINAVLLTLKVGEQVAHRGSENEVF